MRGSFRLPVLLCLTVLGVARSEAQPVRRDELPPVLRPWVAWVLDGAKDSVCTAVDGSAVCLWPGRLRLEASRSGGSFRQEMLADREIEAALPGDAKHWPQGLSLDGKPAPVFDKEGVPTLRLSAGAHVVEGRFSWRQLPDSLSVPARTAIVDLSVDGVPMSLPSRDEQGLLWLHKGGTEATAAESLRVQVFRQVSDGQPLFVTTLLLLEVSGKARELELGGGLLAGTVPVSVAGELPAQIDNTGRLRIQVRSGRFQVRTMARVEGRPEALTAPHAAEPWPDHEIWVFEANERLRDVQLSGANAIDPSRTDLPEEWRKLPAFSLSPGTPLTLKEVRRGEPDAAPDKLQLHRQLWLDLDGKAFTARDTWSGDLNRTWRLDLVGGELGRVAVDGTDQLVTSSPAGGVPGVELRSGSLNMVADSRLPAGELSAVGWSAGVEQLQSALYLPPGWKLLGASGVDSLPGTWMSRWTLLGFFFVLLVAFGTLKLLGLRAACVALFAVGLSYHEPDAPFLVWLSLLAGSAVLVAAPVGRLRTFGRVWWWLSLLALALVLVPFFRDQVRSALFPQIGQAAVQPQNADALSALGDMQTREAAEPKQQAATAAPAAPPEENAAPAVRSDKPARERLKAKPHSATKSTTAGFVDLRSESYANNALQQDPHAVVQTGPGVPTWTWQGFALSWSGPVGKEHRIRLFLLSPRANVVVTFVRLGLIAFFALLLFRMGRAGLKPRPEPEPSATLPGVAAALALMALLFAPAVSAEGPPTPNPAAQDATPTPSILEELRQRLTRPEPCEPRCISTPSLSLSIEGERLSFSAQVDAAARGSWALPGPAQTWVPSEVRVDGQASAALVRLQDGFLRVRLEPGVHHVELSGALPHQDSLTLQLKDRPHHATASAPGFEIVGIHEDGPADESIELTRRLRPGRDVAGNGEGVYAPWLEVRRTVESGVSWRVYTTVHRVTPVGAPIAVRIPLLPGESVTEGDWETKDGEVALTLGRDEVDAKWASTLKLSDTLKLQAPDGRPWSEVWTVRCGVVWECEAKGVPPVSYETAGLYEPEYHPWPGESLQVGFRRPAGVKGQTLTLDDVQLDVSPGTRLETATLTLKTRAAREDTLTLTLPQGVEVQDVKVAGTPRPIRPDGERLSIAVPGGAQTVELSWHRGQGLGPWYRAPQVGLSAPAVNVHVNVTLPDGRWLLLARGPAWGPAVLFWGYLIVMLAAAFLLARLPGSPLTTAQWALLALGLSQIPAPAACVVAGFFFVLVFRTNQPLQRPLLFDGFQLVLVVWALVAIGCLYGAVQTGLLLRPDMQVAGNGSSDTLLSFYVDRVAAATPGVGIVSAPLWVYRVLMLLWSGWLAASLVRWTGWAWRAFTEGGAWRPLRRSKLSVGPEGPQA